MQQQLLSLQFLACISVFGLHVPFISYGKALFELQVKKVDVKVLVLQRRGKKITEGPRSGSEDD